MTRQTKDDRLGYGSCYACGRGTTERCIACNAYLCSRGDCPRHPCDDRDGVFNVGRNREETDDA